MIEQKGISIKVNFVMNAILNISYIVFPLITFPYISRILLPEGTGKISFATSFTNYFLMFSQLGLQTYGIRECSKCREEKDKLTVLVSELFSINCILTVAAYLVLLIIVLGVPKFFEERKLILVMSVSIILNTLGMHYLFKGLEKYTYITVRSIIFKFLALIAMFLLIHSKEDYIVYGGISVFAASASSITNFIHSKKYINKLTFRLKKCKVHIEALSTFFLLDCATTFYTNLDVLMVGFINTNTDVGYYNAAVKIKLLLVSLVTSLGAVLLPRVSYYIKLGDNEKYLSTIKIAFHFIYLISIPMVVFFVINAKQCIYFLSGIEYEKSILPMKIIMPILLLTGLSNLISLQILVPNEHEKYVFISQVAGIAVDFVLNLILIPRFKSTGAAVATVMAEFIVLLFEIYFVKKKTQINILIVNNISKIILISVISGVAIYFVNKGTIYLGVFVSLIISAILFFAIYFGLIFLLGDELVKEIFMNIKKKLIF